MNILLDSANNEDYNKLVNAFNLKGITTNPKLLKKEGITTKEIHKQIEFDLNKKIFIQAKSPEEVYSQKYPQTFISKSKYKPSNIIYKIPLYFNIEKINPLSLKNTIEINGWKTCGTMTYNTFQLDWALENDLDYCILLYNKNEQRDLLFTFALEQRIRRKSTIQYIAASIHNYDDINTIIEKYPEVDYMTVPPQVLYTIHRGTGVEQEFLSTYE